MEDAKALVDRLERAAMAYERLGKITKDDDKARRLRKDVMQELSHARIEIMARLKRLQTPPSE